MIFNVKVSFFSVTGSDRNPYQATIFLNEKKNSSLLILMNLIKAHTLPTLDTSLQPG